MKSSLSHGPSCSTSRQAAQAIVDLINSRPSSPRREEIEAIIDKLARPVSPAASCPHCSDLDREYGPIILRS